MVKIIIIRLDIFVQIVSQTQRPGSDFENAYQICFFKWVLCSVLAQVIIIFYGYYCLGARYHNAHFMTKNVSLIMILF